MEAEKTIIYERTSRDFFAYLDEEFIGAFGSYHEAEAELDRLALAQLTSAAKEPIDDQSR